MKSVREKGFPSVFGYDLYYYYISSIGPHPAVHFIWKVAQTSSDDTDEIAEENAKIVNDIRRDKQHFFNRASRRTVKTLLHRIGVTKPHRAEYLIRTLLGDSSASNQANQKSILERFHEYVSLGNDIICDLRMNNGAKPKFDEFWNIVDEFIAEKTAVDDRRWGSEAEEDTVVSMAVASSLSDIYRKCVQIALSREPPVEIPSKQWFTLQFWPSSKTMTALTYYTGRFKVGKSGILAVFNSFSGTIFLTQSILSCSIIIYRVDLNFPC